MSQNEMILKHMKRAYITPKQAFEMYGCMRLASRINELSKRYSIKRKWKILDNGKKVMEYRLNGK